MSVSSALDESAMPVPRRRKPPVRSIQRKPRPCVRMRELLVIAKSGGSVLIPSGFDKGGHAKALIDVDLGPCADFGEAWEACWAIMRREKSWPHATAERHSWQAVLRETRGEFERCWYGQPSPFMRVATMILTVIADEDVKSDEGVVIALALG